MDEVVANLGYLAILIGTFLEGESVLALGGVAASYGYLSYPKVVGVALLGAFSGDQVAFYLGRRFGPAILARNPKLAVKAARVQALVRRWDAPAVILLRFMYGMRIAGPIVIGSCGISPWRLAFFNFIGALIWAPLIAGLGYVAGQALERWIGRLQHVQLALLMLVALAAVAWTLIHFLRRR
jgi:membrane protein DedA with SNARE-associated domain